MGVQQALQSTSPSVGAIRRLFSKIGPGLITAAVVLGPGSVTVSTRSGALLGCSILWVLAIASAMMVVFTYLGAKIGMLLRESFLSEVARRYGRWVAVLAGVSGFLITTGFQTGDNVGVGIALAEMFGGTMTMWAVIFTVVALALLWGSRHIYQMLEKMMVVLVAVMIASFLGNLLRIHPSGVDILRGLTPSKPAIFGLVVAISATTFSVAAAAFQPYLVRSKGWTAGDVRKGMSDSIIGVFCLVGISAIIMITSATVLKPAGIKVNNAVDMAKQLEPLLGSMAKWLFLSGLWAAAFSSFIS